MPQPSPEEVRLQIQHRLLEELTASEQRYRTLVETMRDGIFLCDAAGSLTFANPAMAELLGRPASTLAGQPLANTVFSEDRAILNDYLDKIVTQHADANIEIRFLRGDGTHFWGLLTLTPPHSGQCTGLLRDISAQKEQQIETAHSTAHLAQVNRQQAMEIADRQAYLDLQIQHMPIGCICWDQSFRVRSWNPSAARIFGFAEREMLGREPWMIVPEEVRPWVSEVWNRLLAGARSVPSVNENLSKDGRRILCSWSNTPLRNRQGLIVGVLSMVEDITVRRLTEQLLEAKNSQLEAVSQAIIGYLSGGSWNEASRSLLHSALLHTQSQYGFMGVVTPGPILRILCHEGITWGPENMEFFSAATRTYQEVGYLEFSAFDNLFGRVITSEQPILANDPANDPRASHRLPAGHPPLRNFLGVPIRHGNQVVGLMGVANHPRGYEASDQQLVQTLTQAAGVLYDSYRQREKSQALAAEKELLVRDLHRAEKLASLGTLLGGVAHELNNPLFIAQGFLRLAQENLREGATEQAANDLTTLEKTLRRASDILTRFLTSTREGPRTGGECYPNKILDDTLTMLSNILLIKQIQLDKNLTPDLPSAVGNGQDLAHVFINVLTNAYQALEEMPGQKTIRVSSRLAETTEPPYIEIVIADNGPGIPEEALPYIFDPFFTTKPVGEGTGLGLSICYQIVSGIGGTITCHSATGKGTTFTVTLKAHASPTPAPPLVAETEKEPSHG